MKNVLDDHSEDADLMEMVRVAQSICRIFVVNISSFAGPAMPEDLAADEQK
jgi:hypothetical protein